MQVTEILTKEEIQRLMKRSNWRGAYEVALNWLWIIAAFVLVAYFPNVLTIVVALFVIGARQLGCSVILHDTGHYSLFKNKKANRIIGNWLGGYPILHNWEQYSRYHVRHHRSNGTEQDPDLRLALLYPTNLKSLFRKIRRDLTGSTGFKSILGVFMMHFGWIEYNLAGNAIKIDRSETDNRALLQQGWKNIRGPLATNLALFGILWAFGQPLLYLLWIGALLTTYNFCVRIRAIAEHSMSPDLSDPVKNVRTTYANFFERIFIAPLNVNYHVEHHLLMGAPSYNYPKMHQILLKKGYYEEGLLEQNYWTILKMAANKTVSKERR